MRVIYLHGFASSPQSSKALFFSQKLRACGVSVDVPRLDQNNFESLTITSQLDVVRAAAGSGPVMLMGSSLGGYLSALFAARYPDVVERLVLLAPGFQFPTLWRRRYTPAQLEQWRIAGSTPVFHYGEKRTLQLGYGLMEDSLQYEDEPDARQPTLIFHGVQDDVVPVSVSEQFCATHPNARLIPMASGHELTDVVEPMWVQTAEFLGLPAH